MAYTLENVKTSQEIFYYLLENHELKEENMPHLYKVYVESDDVQTLVKSQGEIADCSIERYGSVIYLIPDENNFFLGYSKTQLKKELCKSNARNGDYYLVQFTILVLLLEFYDGVGSSSKSRDYIRVGVLQNSITQHLKEGSVKMSEEEQAEHGISFSAMLESYESLRSDENGKLYKTTKEGFLFSILKFLQKQGLIEYIEQDEMIKTTKKLDHFMDWNLLNQKNYQRVSSVIRGGEHE